MWNIEKVISKGDYNYALVRNHPNATKNGYVLLHRIIMENHLGRLLNTDEVVHHLNHNKKDNRLENLQILSNKEHSKIHGFEQGIVVCKLKCPQCGRIFMKQKRQTHLVKKSILNCTFCSRMCNGKFVRKIQLHGLTPDMKNAISENILTQFKIYTNKVKDNSEETDL